MSRTARLPLDDPDLRPTFARERAALRRGIWPVAGCDEAGRGPLAGPVVAAAVVLDPKRIPKGLNDSKKLDRAEREMLYEKICASAEVAVAFGSRARIARCQIASCLAVSSITKVPSSTIRPISSAIEMNSIGDIRPSLG